MTNIGKALLLLVLLLSVYAMAGIAFPYLVPPFPTDIDFLANKPRSTVEQPHYMFVFYIHISSSILTLAAGLTQFSKRLMFRYPKWHRSIGKIYVFTVLCLSAPTGLVMAFYGSGGAAAQWAFMLQAMGWWYLTFMAYRKVLQKDLISHGEYMLRSYAMAFSAITLRAGTYIVATIKIWNDVRCPDAAWSLLCFPNFYVLEAWLSWIVNLVIAEILIMAGLMRYYFGRG